MATVFSLIIRVQDVSRNGNQVSVLSTVVRSVPIYCRFKKYISVSYDLGHTEEVSAAT
jgi:hypothetical protein